MRKTTKLIEGGQNGLQDNRHICYYFYVFYVFLCFFSKSNPKSRDFLRFFAVFRTFSRTMVLIGSSTVKSCVGEWRQRISIVIGQRSCVTVNSWRGARERLFDDRWRMFEVAERHGHERLAASRPTAGLHTRHSSDPAFHRALADHETAGCCVTAQEPINHSRQHAMNK